MKKGNENKIFKQFIYNQTLSFSELFKKTKIPSNLLAYFLKQLTKKELLKKNIHGKYELTSKGEKLIPFYTETESLTPLVVILLLIKEKNRVLLIKREKRPYKELFSLVSGRIFLEESINSAAKRICKQKLGSECNVDCINSVVHERLIDKEIKHAFVFFVVSVKLTSQPNPRPEIKWFDINRIPKKRTIASDYWVIKNKSNSKTEVVEEVLEKNGKKIKLI